MTAHIDEFELLRHARGRWQAPPIVWISLSMILIVAVGTSGWLYRENQRLDALIHNPISLAQTQEAALITAVGERIELPPGERPTIVSVSDLTAVRGQAFFANAAVGDVALIYLVAKEAILYRPSTKRIIQVGPVSGAEPASSSVPTGPANPTDGEPTPSLGSSPAAATGSKSP